MHQGSVRSESGNGLETESPVAVDLAAVSGKRVLGSQLIDLDIAAGPGGPVEPRKERGESGAVANMAVPHALDFDGILDGLRQGAGVGAEHGFTAGLRNATGEPGRTGLAIDDDSRAIGGRFIQTRSELRQGLDDGTLRQPFKGFGRELPPVRVERDRAFLPHDGEAEAYRGPRKIAAPDVEKPCDRRRIGDDRGSAVLVCKYFCNPFDLRGGRFASVFQAVRANGRERRRGPVGPDRVDRVVPAGHKFSASLCDGPFEGLDFPGAVQPGIITEPAAGEVLCDPVGRRLVDQMMEREVFLPHLDRDLERVAAVDEDRGLLHQYDCRARRAAETCQPGEPLAPPGQHFTLVFIGVRYDETVEPEPLEFAAHSLQAPGRSRRRGIEAVFRPGCNRRLQRPELIPQFVTRLCCHQAQPQITVHILRRGKHTGDNSAYIGNRLSRSLCRQQFGKTKIVPIAGWIIGEGSGHGSVRTFRRG